MDLLLVFIKSSPKDSSSHLETQLETRYCKSFHAQPGYHDGRNT
jgi:hypothetical protein